eukprot:9263617-Pyramimonas_sp.AAC.1
MASPGVDGQKGLRLQFNSRQSSSTVDTSTPFGVRHFEYSVEYSTYIPCRQTAIGWPTVDSGACSMALLAERALRRQLAAPGLVLPTLIHRRPSEKSVPAARGNRAACCQQLGSKVAGSYPHRPLHRPH